jgi:post-segregation antitoxin (ccd killing protein)
VNALGKKKITTMRIDAELIKKAHDLGLTVSRISENAIKEAIEKMEA